MVICFETRSPKRNAFWRRRINTNAADSFRCGERRVHTGKMFPGIFWRVICEIFVFVIKIVFNSSDRGFTSYTTVVLKTETREHNTYCNDPSSVSSPDSPIFGTV